MKKNYSYKQIKDSEEWNKLIDILKEKVILRRNQPYEKIERLPLSVYYFLDIKEKNCFLTTSQIEGKPVCYVFTLDEEDWFDIHGCQLARNLMRCSEGKIANFSEDEEIKRLVGWDSEYNKFANKQAGLLFYNTKRFNNKTVEAYQYDLNSAYLSMLYNQIPDTSVIVGRNREIREGEIGFIFDLNLSPIFRTGNYADIIFKLVDSPESIKKYCKRWYKKRKVTDSRKKVETKLKIVSAIGGLQYYNPFLRAYIIEKCNRLIDSMRDEDTILCNTDSVYSLHSYSINLGSDLGQWKCEKGPVTLINSNYKTQDKETHRGVPLPIYKMSEDGRVERL